MMPIAAGLYTYTWNSNWAKLPDEIKTGYTHGVVVDEKGLIHIFNQSPHAVLTFDAEGNFIGTWDEFPNQRFLGAHGMTLMDEDGEQFLWLTDQNTCEVVKTTLDGQTVLNIDRPKHPTYTGGGKYSPTWAVQSPVDGIIFVADGYGSGFVNRYDKSGQYIDSFDGSAGSHGDRKFACPHGVYITTRPTATGTTDPVLYVTDRGNSRVQVFDLNCRFIKAFHQEHPCCFTEHNGDLIVPDLHAAGMIYDDKDELVATIGQNMDILSQHDWPNVPHEMRVDGKFNSPHGGVADPDGNIYIVEWIKEGRITKLTRQ